MQKRKHLEISLAVVMVVFFYMGMQAFGITCPIKYFTGISCAGCGMTRAWLAFLQGRIALAFSFHPLFFLAPVMLLIFLLRSRIQKKIYWIFWYLVIALFFIVYFIRLFDGDNAIVVFRPQDGFILRLIRTFL